jgi:RNA polymerase sigma factor (sigma-70 family)
MIRGPLENPVDLASTSAAPDEPKWPARIRELALDLRSERDPRRRERALSELWTLVNLALQRYVRASARRIGRLDHEDVRDIAAEKALDFLRRLDDPQWDASAYSPAQVCTFLRSMARNGLVDRTRQRKKEVSWTDELEDDMQAMAFISSKDTSASVDGDEYARAMVACLSSLTVRARLVWFLRVFYELQSVAIARHARVRSTPAAVDTMLMRCRDRLRECMAGRGLDPSRMPPGTFTALWEIVHDASRTGGES